MSTWDNADVTSFKLFPELVKTNNTCCLSPPVGEPPPRKLINHVCKKVFVRFLYSSQSSSPLASLRSVMLQYTDFEIRYLAGMRFIDTAKYHGSTLSLLRLLLLLLSRLNCFHTSNDLNFLNSLLTTKNGNEITFTVTRVYLIFQYN